MRPGEEREREREREREQRGKDGFYFSIHFDIDGFRYGIIKIINIYHEEREKGKDESGVVIPYGEVAESGTGLRLCDRSKVIKYLFSNRT